MAYLKSFLLLLIAYVTLCNLALALPTPSSSQPEHKARAVCTNPFLRKSWDVATTAEKKSYTKAVLCLATKPSRIGLPTTLYDDFPWVHNKLGQYIHGTAQFLPWHRYFVHIYEQALKSCGYTGVAMYWDWVADSSHPASSKVWSPTDGFGGNGTDSSDIFQRCITNGPYTSLRPAYYGNDTHPHCILRTFMPAYPGLQEMIGFSYNADVIAGVNSNTQFATFHGALEGGPHGAVHAAIASSYGDMGPLTSPNDPIFFLHHTQVDRLWWLWQQADPVNRLNDFSGTEIGGVNATLDDIMLMNGLSKDRRVKDFMSTQTLDLCYKY